MPIYEYECQACGHRMEARQKMNDPRLTECPACSRPELRKLMSAANVHGSRASNPATPACGADRGAMPPCAAGSCPVMNN